MEINFNKNLLFFFHISQLEPILIPFNVPISHSFQMKASADL